MKKQKRLTAAQKKEQEIVAIRARIEDMARGAFGGASVEDDPENGVLVWKTLSPEAFGNWVDAIRRTFHPEEENFQDWSMNFGPYAIHHFESLDKAAAYLYELGVRV